MDKKLIDAMIEQSKDKDSPIAKRLAETAIPTLTQDEIDRQDYGFCSEYAPLLNALCSMQESLIYAARKNILVEAENTIVRLEAALKHRREASAKELAESQAETEEARDLLQYVVGVHFAPNDCYSTGPATGTIKDELCPSCVALEHLKFPPRRTALDFAINKAVENALREAARVCNNRASSLDEKFAYSEAVECSICASYILTLIPKPEKG